MNVTETKRTIKGLPPRESVLLQGKHGLGKSQIMNQICKELSESEGVPFELVDLRLSQKEVGDILGMPKAMEKYTGKTLVWDDGVIVEKTVHQEDVTLYNLPSWFPSDPDSHGILFLDELNRATREVQQAAFELVLDYRLNFHDLPKGWRVVSAINEDQDVYSVLSLDPALIDRFMVIDFKPTIKEWEAHAEKCGVHAAIMSYISAHSSSLDTPEKTEPGIVYPSRRSWFKFSDAIKHMADRDDDPLKDPNYLTLLAKGYIGSTTSISFVDFVRENYKVFKPEDILNKMPTSMENELQDKEVMEATHYCNELVKHLKTMKTMDKKQSSNLIKFYKAIPREAASGFWHEFSKECRGLSTVWFRNNPEVKKYTMEIIGKKSMDKSLKDKK